MVCHFVELVVTNGHSGPASFSCKFNNKLTKARKINDVLNCINKLYNHES